MADIQILPRDSLLSSFLNSLARECNEARDNNQSVLLFLFGHGKKEPIRFLLAILKTKMRAIRRTIFSNFRLLGGDRNRCRYYHCVYPAIQVAGRSLHLLIRPLSLLLVPEESESWPASKSLSRLCGSIYASALIQALSREASSKRPRKSPKELHRLSAEDICRICPYSSRSPVYAD